MVFTKISILSPYNTELKLLYESDVITIKRDEDYKFIFYVKFPSTFEISYVIDENIYKDTIKLCLKEYKNIKKYEIKNYSDNYFLFEI